LAIGQKNAAGSGALIIGHTAVTPSSTLTVSAATNLTGSNAVSNSVTVNRDFTVAGASDIEFSGATNLGAANRTITVTNTGSTTISGVIDNGGLTKAGSGILTLTGASTYVGGTTIVGGTLKANNVTGSATGSGVVVVDNGGTLAGTGSVSGPVIVKIMGTLAPGASIESLDVGALTFEGDPNGGSSTDASVFHYEINSGASLTAAADLVNANGALNLGVGTLLSISDLGSSLLAFGTRFTLINYSGTWDGGTFAGLPNYSTTLTIGSNRFAIRYDDPAGGSNFGGGAFGPGTGHVTLTAVPEASAFLTVGLGGIFAIAAICLSKRAGVSLLNI
jgi:fibronectin-binding autotransporter adhesin